MMKAKIILIIVIMFIIDICKNTINETKFYLTLITNNNYI